MLRNRNDLKSVAFVLIIFSLQLFIFFIVDGLALAGILALLLLPFQASIIACHHNHCHNQFFQSKALNLSFESLLFLQTGIAPYAWTLHHVIGHHGDYLDQARDTSPWLNANGSTMNRWYYCFRNTVMIYPGAVRIGRQYPSIFRKFLLMLPISFGLIFLFGGIDVSKALLVFFIPMVLMQFYLVDATFAQHSGLDTSDPMTATQNCLNRTYNICAWNLGFHTAHHLKPGLHWSKLPEFHRQISDTIPDSHITHHWGPIFGNKPL